MNRSNLIAVLSVLFVFTPTAYAQTAGNLQLSPIRPVVACTMDAKICPDGTTVGRTGPNCEFAACPIPSTTGSVTTAPQEASTDFYLKLNGIEGETSEPPPPPPPPPQNAPTQTNPMYKETQGSGTNPMHEEKKFVPPPLPPGDPDFDLIRVRPNDSSNMSGNENWDFGGDDALKGGVNVATGDVNGDGIDDIVFSAPPGRAAGYIKFDGVDGESTADDTHNDAAKGKNIRKNITINLRASELRTSDDATRQEVFSRAPTTTDAVRTGDDLALHILSRATSDTAIEQVSLNFEKISMKHSARGKLFGFIPMQFTEQVEIDTSESAEPGTVKVKLPWYGFLVNEDVDPEDIEAEVKKKHKETIEIESWSWGISQRAEVFNTVSNILKTKHDTVKNSIGNVR